MKTFQFPVSPGQVRRMSDPITSGRDLYYVHVPLSAIPPDLPLDINPRSQRLNSPVAVKIRKSLEKWPERFHLLNRGITTICEKAFFDNQTNIFTLVYPDDSSPTLSEFKGNTNGSDAFDLDRDIGLGSLGIVDGGHTYAVIRDVIDNADEQLLERLNEGFVRLEVITGISNAELITELARARNTSAQVKEQSLDDFVGKFDWIKKRLNSAEIPQVIKYEENGSEPVDVRFIIQLLTAFHPAHLELYRSPVHAYSSAGSCANDFSKEDGKTILGYRSLENILPEIIDCYGYVRVNFQEWYRDVGGYEVKNERSDQDQNLPVDPRSRGKIGDDSKGFSKPNRVDRSLFPHLIPDKSDKRIYDEFFVPDFGYVMPMLSSFRGLTKINGQTGQLEWAMTPRDYLKQNKYRLTRTLLREANGENKDPQKIGKKRNFWDSLHKDVDTDIERLHLKIS